MRNLLGSLIALLLFTFSTTLLTAQTGKDQLYKITSVQIHPSKVMAYEKAVSDLGKAMIAADATTVELHANQTEDFTYYYAVPINNMEALFTNEWAATVAKVGEEKFMDLYGKVVACERESSADFYLHKADFSYYHASSRGQAQNYRVWTVYQFKAGTQKEVAAIAKEFKALCKKHDVSMNYGLYFGVLGDNDNVVVRLDSAKDAVTYEQQQAKAAEKIGKEVQPLMARLFAIVDKMEIKRGYYLPRFSSVPEKTTAVAEKEDK